ncbi:MAG TPA: BamA/TamA family outer membrane protein [Dinghuibacter sp.]|uniref:BamA/TamA family outer membrane protein n=1 Tax=Dinghuibacter sp. TaxID=2024697 RepID=UPI002BD2E462|nr:BamA/TamA family outer membrane protein [Dinghuibacter sp.]HTJ11442.1 BamA/TamA family outer membrane protein [Dinghuibacter sp.]
MRYALTVILLTQTLLLKAQDSLLIQANASFDKVGHFHRWLLGENYRKEWSAPTNLPVIRLSEIHGGLIVLQPGGGHQTHSLRLRDKTGKEWVLRSVNKYPEILLPETLRQTFAKDVVTDAMSAQHPYSALSVPVLAEAAGVPHAHPIIGWVAPDTALGEYAPSFARTVCLLEEREPTGPSDNSFKLYKELDRDNDNTVDTVLFLRARLLDLLIGDWDRHEDQWRWTPEPSGKGVRYQAVPRDRDQAFHMIDGVIPHIATAPWIVPFLHDFNGRIKKIDAFFTESNAMNKRLLSGFDYDRWMAVTYAFTAVMTDSVLGAAIRDLPLSSYKIDHDRLLALLKERRQNLPAAMAAYYRFLNRVVDLPLSNKDEFVSITDATDQRLLVRIYKIGKKGELKQQFYERVFDPSVTREIRVFTAGGDDSVRIDNETSIRLRLTGGKGNKVVYLDSSAGPVKAYFPPGQVRFAGDLSVLRKHLSADTLNKEYVPTNPYDKVIPSITGGYNLDDGLLLGAGVKFVNQGFRRKPYASMQELSFKHSFSTKAFAFRFHSEWLETIGKADLVLDAKALAPDNTQNFFGLGNNTPFDKTGDYKRFYRSRFNIFQVDPSLRWRWGKRMSLYIGPSVQYYHMDSSDNRGRIVTQPGLLHSYDSLTVTDDKDFAGLSLRFDYDTRNRPLLPTAGIHVNARLQAYEGLNAYSKSFVQFIPEITFYQHVDPDAVVVLADRVGGGLTGGRAAFYQSLFLGGQENLWGYRQYRFAGSDVLYNNLEAHIRIARLASYILPGELGLTGFYDIGRVWADGDDGDTWHQGVGGGIYFAPAQLLLLQFVMGHSDEGWYPYVTMGFRF